MSSNMKYPMGMTVFEEIRKGSYVYVDKTAYVYKMVSKGKYYFLSRPRRFGKTLLVNTLESFFLGKKELFDGLAIATLEKEWLAYPVLHLDLTGTTTNNLTDLSLNLDFATICGITDEELRVNFDEGVALLAQARSETKEQTYHVLRQTYDGYHFRHDSPGLYNPFSLILALNNKEINNY